jgi:hypothetical protein
MGRQQIRVKQTGVIAPDSSELGRLTRPRPLYVGLENPIDDQARAKQYQHPTEEASSREIVVKAKGSEPNAEARYTDGVTGQWSILVEKQIGLFIKERPVAIATKKLSAYRAVQICDSQDTRREKDRHERP